MAVSKSDIWMPIYIGDYLADTSHLDAERHGCYLLLLMHYWRKGPLIPDINSLTNVARLPNDRGVLVIQPILDEFFVLNEDGRWHQKRLDYEREKANGNLQKGIAGANAKWGIDSQQEGKMLRSERLAEARRKGTHTQAEWESLQAFCRHHCVKCQASNCELVKDHILPLYKGGSDGIENIQPLCRKCNAQKGPESKDYRQNGWQNACKMPANVCPLPSPLPKEQVQKPSRAKRVATKTEAQKTRHAEFKAAIGKYWDSRNPGVEMPWGRRRERTSRCG